MSTSLDERAARLTQTRAFLDLSIDQRWELAEVVYLAEAFDELPAWVQQAIQVGEGEHATTGAPDQREVGKDGVSS